MAEVTGSVAFVHNDEQFHTFYKIIGDLQSGVRPLIVLHGGPGIFHHYMLPHALLASYHHVPVIFYDQIGVGESSHPKGKPASFWSMDLFKDQLDGFSCTLEYTTTSTCLGTPGAVTLPGSMRLFAALEASGISSSRAHARPWSSGSSGRTRC